MTVGQLDEERQPASHQPAAETPITRAVRHTRRSGKRLGRWLLGPFDQALARVLHLAQPVALGAVAVGFLLGLYLIWFPHVVFRGRGAYLHALAWSGLLPIGLSVLLAEMARANAAVLLRGPQAGPPAAAWHRPPPLNPGNEDACWRVRAVLLTAIAACLLWLVWQKPGPWQDGLIVAVTVALATPKPRWLERRAAASARRARAHPARFVIGRIGVLDLRPGRAPAARRAAIALLALLNALLVLALVNTVVLTAGQWAVHTTIAFIVMSCVNLGLLNLTLSASPAAAPMSPDYLTVGSLNGHARGPAAAAPDWAVAAPKSRRVRRRALRVLSLLRPHRRRARRSLRKARSALAAAAVMLAAGLIGYAHPGLLLSVAVLVVGCAVLSTINVTRHQAVTMMLGVALGVATLDYVTWRFSVTNWQGWWIAVPLLLAESLGALHILGFQFTVWPWPTPVIEPGEDPSQHAIFMLVPTVNEGAVILRPTLEGCIAARQEYLAAYPQGKVTIVVCNDGRVANVPRWAEAERLAEALGVCCVTRTTAGGAKAGNIENARQELGITGDSFLVIFDADQVPKPDFLLKTIPPFADAQIGWVQTGQYYANLGNPVSRWADDQQSMFYNLLCPGKAALNAAFICGTNVVIRAAALDEIGGLPQDSVTEDFAASIALHRTWRSIYLTDVLATGLGPLDVPAYLKQQGRWAFGTLGVFRSNWRDILLPGKNGLRLGQRVQYLLACTHYLCGLRDLVYMVTPVLFIFTGVPAVRTATLANYLWHFLPYALLGLAGMWYSARGVTGLRGIIIGFGSSPALIRSLAGVILGRKRPFAITSKEGDGLRSLRYLGIYAFCLALCIVAAGWATQVRGRQATSLFISLLWVTYSLLILSSYLWLAYKDIRLHRAAQPSGSTAITAKRPYPSKLLVRKNGLGPVVNLGLAALVASPLLLGTRLASLPLFETPVAAPFVISPRQIDARYLGVSLPAPLLNQPPALEHDLSIRFSIVGRTQDITDRFDTAWADRLAAQGARPWISLEFGNFGADHRPALTASLPAIYNGVDDPAIKRWATEIRDFGKPVYLTVLLHADKNWAVSSGVANGGIPEDVPKAWMHIQAVFRAAQANNVAWVWAPADPVRDQRFAPPPSTIGVVLQSFINYPGTTWGDPEKVLRSLTRRYPGKPFFIEVSVPGPAAEKVAWLARLGQAVDHCPQAYALLYHQGGPQLKPTPAQQKSWSLASDPQSLAAWKRVVTDFHPAGRSG